MKMKNTFPVTTLVTLFLIFDLLFAAGRVAVTTKATGEVELIRAKKAAAQLKPGTVLEDGDKIKTGSNGYTALIFIDDKSVLKIKGNTELEITGKRLDANISKKINMDRGTLRAQVTKQTKSDFVIQTPTSVASVKGTDFWMISDPINGDQLIGLEGVVSFANLISGISLDIGGGFTGVSLADGSLDSDVTIPDVIPDDPDEDTDTTEKSELKIQFQGPDGSLKTLIIEYQ